jgi:hypothetical protein
MSASDLALAAEAQTRVEGTLALLLRTRKGGL